MTEDDTYKALCRVPFYEVNKKFLQHIINDRAPPDSTRIDYEGYELFLNEFGWTYDEYVQEHRKVDYETLYPGNRY